MSQRVSRPGRNPYNSPGNQIEIYKSASGKLRCRKAKKLAKPQRCSDCKQPLKGVAVLRPAAFRRAKKSQRTVARVHGGSVCGDCVEGRVLKGFLTEEQKHLRAAKAEQ